MPVTLSINPRFNGVYTLLAPVFYFSRIILKIFTLFYSKSLQV